MGLPDLEVQRVVPGRDLERAGAELRVDALVLDHGYGALDERDDHLAADRALKSRSIDPRAVLEQLVFDLIPETGAA